MLDAIDETDTDALQPNDFSDISDCSFHRDESLVGEDFSESDFRCQFDDIQDASFREEDSLLENMEFDLQPGHFPIPVQTGGGLSDYDIKLIKKKQLKRMGAVDVNNQLTFKDKMFKERRKMKDVQNILRNASDEMIAKVKNDLQPGDIMRAAIHNDALDIPVFIPCRQIEQMNAEAIL